MIIIIEDRYRGAYCGGAWVCVSSMLDAFRIYEGGAMGNDTSAGDFWLEQDDADWLAVGNTPDDAVAEFRAGRYGTKATCDTR